MTTAELMKAKLDRDLIRDAVIKELKTAKTKLSPRLRALLHRDEQATADLSTALWKCRVERAVREYKEERNSK